MQKRNSSPGSLDGGPGDRTSPHNGTRDYSSAKIKNPSLPMRVRREDIAALQPLERAYAEYLIETRPGEVFVLVDDAGGV